MYLPAQGFNVDETGLSWKRMPDQNYISKQEKLMPVYKAAKDRLTLLFDGNASGDMKLKPLLVHHSENPRALRNIAKGSFPVVWKSNPRVFSCRHQGCFKIILRLKYIFKIHSLF